MKTERYITRFFGFDKEIYTCIDISYLWEECANREYKKSGTYITALVECNDYVGEKNSGDSVFSVLSIRNPIYSICEEKYWEAFKRVVKEVREKLGNPCMTIAKEVTDFYYFFELL